MNFRFLSFSPSADYFVIFWGWIFSAISFGILLPFISIYFINNLNLSITEVGYFFLATSIFRAIFQAYGGEISDKIGRKNVILFSLFGRSFFLVILCIPFNFSENFWINIILLAFTYIFSAIFQPVTQAAIADLVPDSKFLEGFSIIRIGGNVGWIIGPIMGGYLYEFSKSIYFFISALFSILGGLIFLLFFKNIDQKYEYHKRTIYRYIFHNRLFMIFCGISFFMMLTTSQLLSSLPYYLNKYRNVNPSFIGYIFSLNGLTVILFQIPILKLFKNIDSFLGMSLGALLYGSGYFMVGYCTDTFHYFLIVFIISLAETIVLPLVQSSVVNLSSKTTFGRYMGFFGIISVTGWSIGPMIGTIILDNIQSSLLAWLYISSFSLSAGIGYLTIFYKFKKEKRILK